MAIRGILLCGGAATRFGANKLLAADGSGEALVARSARRLVAAVPSVLAVVRPGEPRLREALQAAGCEVLETGRALGGIGASLAAAVEASAEAEGWIVALGDMPYVEPATIAGVRAALERGALIAAPIDPVTGERGHPVGFAARLREELAALDRDEGARSVIARHRHALVPVPVDDRGIFLDIDTPHDLPNP